MQARTAGPPTALANWQLAQEPAPLGSIEPLQQTVVMGALPRVREVEVIDRRSLRVTFTDDLVRELDLAPTLAGVLAALDSDDTFAAVGVDTVTGTVCWPGGLDLDPDVLHGDRPAASPSGAPRLIRQHRLDPTIWTAARRPGRSRRGEPAPSDVPPGGRAIAPHSRQTRHGGVRRAPAGNSSEGRNEGQCGS